MVGKEAANRINRKVFWTRCAKLIFWEQSNRMIVWCGMTSDAASERWKDTICLREVGANTR